MKLSLFAKLFLSVIVGFILLGLCLAGTMIGNNLTAGSNPGLGLATYLGTILGVLVIAFSFTKIWEIETK